MGRLGEAATELERERSKFYWETEGCIYAAKGIYLLGVIYERSGWINKAIEQYEEFLDIWKDADPGIPEVEDAKERLAKLRKGE